MIRRLGILLVFTVACGGLIAAAHRQGRDSASVPAATASIAGTVLVDGAAKQPARRVRVTLTDLAGASRGQTTTTDDAGAFTFRGVPAGRFELQAFKAGYLRGSYGAARPNRPGTPIVIKDGDAIAGLGMTIARGGVITGVVRDPRGRPLAGLNVRVLKLGYNPLTGERTLGAMSSASTVTSDDRGEYRAFGLPPGSYLVLVAPLSTGRSGGPGVDDIRQLTSAEVQRALQAAKSGAIAPASGPAAPLSTPTARVSYAPIFHPGVTDIGSAPAIALGLSEERTGIDVVVQLVPSATISGRVISPGGPMPSISIAVIPAGASAGLLAGAGVRPLSTQPRADGTYVIAGVPPGAYTVKTIFGRGRGAQPDVATVWAAADVTVTGLDLDVPLTLQPGIPIAGRVVFEGAQPTPAELQTLSFSLMPPGSGGAMLYSPGGGRVDAEGRFAFAGVPPDTYQFVMTWNTPGAGGKWSVKSSIANGRDAFEAPLRVTPNAPVDWTITLTDKPTTLGGVLQDRSGRAAVDYFVLVFSADRQHWMPGSRRVQMTRPATDGAFSAKGLPPGEYFVAALTDLEPGEWNDPALLEQLVGSAVKVTLSDGQVTTQDFRIGS
jgi:uncharacterized protein (DUF2141 family)